ncbi:MAG: hypothetical protein GX774_17535 [Armatimonadetes bacterium]|jgi:uncharacterized protein (DUF697 family)|nr:hypothetical protein [Armatimonadota bacterium]
MAIVGPLGLVNLIREVSAAALRKQADQVPRVVLCGTPDERERLRALLLAGSQGELDRARFAQAVSEVDCPLAGEEIPHSLNAQVVFTLAPPDETLRRLKVPVFQVTDAASLAEAAAALADQQEEWLLSLARHVPGLRAVLAERLIAATSAGNAQIALISALPGVVPIAQVLLGPAAAADIVILTKNQVMMVLKLAAMYGRKVDLTARVWEITPVVGSAFGWRALARELVGAVPGGVGVVAKGTVAYAGTYTVGRAAQLFYQRGKPPSEEEKRDIYRDALESARERVAAMWERLRRERKEEPAAQPAAAPPAADDSGAVEEPV